MTQAQEKAFVLSENSFYPKVKAMLKKSKPKEYALVSLDFDNFNFINDMFGFEVGDKTLKSMEHSFLKGLNEGEFFSRVHADHFVFLVKIDYATTIERRFEKITDVKEQLKKFLPEHYNFVCSGGIVIIDNPKERLTTILDKANFSRKKAKGNHKNTFLYYDVTIKEELEWKKIITLTMESALKKREFEMYLQPKFCIATNKIIGAEALARWNSEQYGMIYPNNFIPVFEQNGFIKLLDFFMLEEACLFLNYCREKSLPMLAISVNFSKEHIRTENLVERIYKVCEKHNIPQSLIEIEFTESAVSSDLHALADIAASLKQLGFSVALDDFGSAYSSLNHLREMPLDVIKIDRDFLKSAVLDKRGKLIIGKIIELVKGLKLTAVVEGVETREQLNLLKELGCEMGQGFFYAKPMPKDKYLSFMSTFEIIDQEHVYNTDTFLYDSKDETPEVGSWELYKIGKEIDMAIVKTYFDRHLGVIYANDKAVEYMGCTRREFREEFHQNGDSLTDPNDNDILRQKIEQLCIDKKPVTFSFRIMHKDGKQMRMDGFLSYAQDDDGKPMGIFAYHEVAI